MSDRQAGQAERGRQAQGGAPGGGVPGGPRGGGAARSGPADDELAALWHLLEAVVDPEIPVLSIRDLGILRDIRRDGDRLRVVITPTYSGCPAMHVIEDEVRAALARAGHGQADQVEIVTQLSPAWTTDWLSAAGRAKLSAHGIAPPPSCAAAAAGAGATVACPQCGSPDTRRVSEFGATACKALYQCQACLEPFDHFKCH